VREKIKNAVSSYATTIDSDYAQLLRSRPELKAYANKVLEAKVRRIVRRRLSNGKAGLRVSGLKLTTGSVSRKRDKRR
jgi:hypothetical protein